jgi:hypothetical protein
MTTFGVAPTAPADTAYGYSSLVRDAIQARQAMDTGRWLIGEYARTLVTHYREKTIEDFADDIGIDAKRVYEYGAMASYYPLETRAALSHLDLNYSQYREARRLKDLNKSIEFLEQVALNVWTIAQTRQALKDLFNPDTPPSYSDGPAMTDRDNRPFHERPAYQWRGPAIVSFDGTGGVRLQCDSIPHLEPEKRYMVSFEEY